MQAAIATTALFRADGVVGLLVAGEPDATQTAVVELDVLGHTRAQAGFHERAEFLHVLTEQVDVIDTARRDALSMEAACVVLQRRLVGLVRHVATGIVVDLEDVAERILESERLVAAVADVAVDPADDLVLGSLDRLDAALKRSLRRATVGYMP